MAKTYTLITFTIEDSERDDFEENKVELEFDEAIPPLPRVGDRIELRSTNSHGNSEYLEYEVHAVITAYEDAMVDGTLQNQITCRVMVAAPDEERASIGRWGAA